MTELQSGSFESLVSRPDTHAVLELDGAGRTLLVLFGGIAGGVSMPVFEFFRLTSSIPGKKAFLRDPRRAWYQLGIPGIGDSVDAVRGFLDALIERAGVDRVVMAGASAGGFAALQFGTWCGADEVIAFSPQTFIDAENRRQFGDTRWPEQIDALYNAATSRTMTFDLLDVLEPLASEKRFQVHVSSDDALDVTHANRIANLSGVEIFEHHHGGHRLVRTLRDRGLLKPILLRALSADRSTDDPSLG